jgi:hypothetical protein
MEHGRQRRCRAGWQSDLFPPNSPAAAVSATARAKLLALLTDLLTEIALAAGSHAEDRHDQDHR